MSGASWRGLPWLGGGVVHGGAEAEVVHLMLQLRCGLLGGELGHEVQDGEGVGPLVYGFFARFVSRFCSVLLRALVLGAAHGAAFGHILLPVSRFTGPLSPVWRR